MVTSQKKHFLLLGRSDRFRGFFLPGLLQTSPTTKGTAQPKIALPKTNHTALTSTVSSGKLSSCSKNFLCSSMAAFPQPWRVNVRSSSPTLSTHCFEPAWRWVTCRHIVGSLFKAKPPCSHHFVCCLCQPADSHLHKPAVSACGSAIVEFDSLSIAGLAALSK